MFCIQRLDKSKFCIIMNVQKLYIHQIPKYIQKSTNCTNLLQSLD